MSKFAPDHLRPSTLRSLAKALKRASGELFDTALPLGQAQELLARTFDYPTWAAAMAQAQSNLPSGLPTPSEYVCFSREATRKDRCREFAYLMDRLIACPLFMADPVTNLDWLRKESAALGEPTWSAWSTQLSEALNQVPLPEAVSALTGFAPGSAELGAYQPEVPSAYPDYEGRPLRGWLDIRPNWNDAASASPSLYWKEIENQDGEESRLKIQIEELSRYVPGAALLLSWKARADFEWRHLDVAQWVMGQRISPTMYIGRDAWVSALFSDRSQVALLFSLWNVSQATGLPSFDFMVIIQAILVNHGYVNLAHYFADYARLMKSGRVTNMADQLAQDLALVNREWAVRFMESARLGSFQSSMRALADDVRNECLPEVSSSGTLVLGLLKRLDMFLEARMPRHQSIDSLLNTARRPSPLGNPEEVYWLEQLNHYWETPRLDASVFKPLGPELNLAIAIAAQSDFGVMTTIGEMTHHWFKRVTVMDE